MNLADKCYSPLGIHAFCLQEFLGSLQELYFKAGLYMKKRQKWLHVELKYFSDDL